ncbi:DNA polymerase delta subunit 4 [Marasmius crinis-equi]|uniref:DNA polymerase delta subunit 4 n=1 Tax=Marasmius crinis-equi TaxID=585013 RepID=A0ABR3F6U4_9AGAR
MPKSKTASHRDPSQRQIHQYFACHSRHKQSRPRKSEAKPPTPPPSAVNHTRVDAGSSTSTLYLDPTERKLHEFDFTSKYGPCLNMSRRERWERAFNLGLDPPIEVSTCPD